MFRLRPDLALVQTVDFFPPVVDDPREFGRIAAANALSDCYAMGALPRTALNVVGFPRDKLPIEVLGEILAGGAEKVAEAGAVVVGGHTVEDREVKYGLAITGTIDPTVLVTNSGATPGDVLVLTKPIGTGSVATAIKKRKTGAQVASRAIAVMSTLNCDASSAMVDLGARSATDITGFGLLGHAMQLARSSGVTLKICSRDIPLLPGALELAQRGVVSGGVVRNREYVEGAASWDGDRDSALTSLLLDSETSGGLLIALGADEADQIVRRLREKGHPFTTVVGEVEADNGTPLRIV